MGDPVTFAHVTASNVIDAEQGRVPDSATLIADPGTWITGLPFLSTAVQQSCGWYQVQTTTRPADTSTNTSDRSLTWTGSAVQEVWTVRAKTAAELDADVAAAEREADAAAIDEFLADADVDDTLDKPDGSVDLAALHRTVKQLIRQTRRQARQR